MMYASNTNTRDERSLMSRANESYISTSRLPPEFISCRGRFTHQTAVRESSSLDAGNLGANELSERIDQYLLELRALFIGSLLLVPFFRSIVNWKEWHGICYFQRLIVRDMSIVRIIIDNSNSFRVIIVHLSVQCIYSIIVNIKLAVELTLMLDF